MKSDFTRTDKNPAKNDGVFCLCARRDLKHPYSPEITTVPNKSLGTETLWERVLAKLSRAVVGFLWGITPRARAVDILY